MLACGTQLPPWVREPPFVKEASKSLCEEPHHYHTPTCSAAMFASSDTSLCAIPVRLPVDKGYMSLVPLWPAVGTYL